MASKISIANQALTWLGADTITSFSDGSTEAGVVAANYDGVRDAVLEDAAWTFATRRAILTPSLTPPPFGYSYEFPMPVDLLRVLTVRDDQRVDGPSNLDWAKEGNRITCNSKKVYLKYIARVEDPLVYSPNFIQAFATRLAADMAVPISGSRAMQSDMWGLYMKKLSDAKSLDGMQGRAQRTGKNNFARVRGTSGSGSAAGPTV